MTTQLIYTGLFLLTLIGSFDSLEAMTEAFTEYEPPLLEIDADREYWFR